MGASGASKGERDQYQRVREFDEARAGRQSGRGPSLALAAKEPGDLLLQLLHPGDGSDRQSRQLDVSPRLPAERPRAS